MEPGRNRLEILWQCGKCGDVQLTHRPKVCQGCEGGGPFDGVRVDYKALLEKWFAFIAQPDGPNFTDPWQVFGKAERFELCRMGAQANWLGNEPDPFIDGEESPGDIPEGPAARAGYW